MTPSQASTYRVFAAARHSAHLAAHPALRAQWLEAMGALGSFLDLVPTQGVARTVPPLLGAWAGWGAAAASGGLPLRPRGPVCFSGGGDRPPASGRNALFASMQGGRCPCCAATPHLADVSLCLTCPTLGATLVQPECASSLALSVHGAAVTASTRSPVRVVAALVSVSGAAGAASQQVFQMPMPEALRTTYCCQFDLGRQRRQAQHQGRPSKAAGQGSEPPPAHPGHVYPDSLVSTYLPKGHVTLAPALLQLQPAVLAEALAYAGRVQAAFCAGLSPGVDALLGSDPLRAAVLATYKRHGVPLPYALGSFIPTVAVSCPQLVAVAVLDSTGGGAGSSSGGIRSAHLAADGVQHQLVGVVEDLSAGVRWRAKGAHVPATPQQRWGLEARPVAPSRRLLKHLSLHQAALGALPHPCCCPAHAHRYETSCYSSLVRQLYATGDAEVFFQQHAAAGAGSSSRSASPAPVSRSASPAPGGGGGGRPGAPVPGPYAALWLHPDDAERLLLVGSEAAGPASAAAAAAAALPSAAGRPQPGAAPGAAAAAPRAPTVGAAAVSLPAAIDALPAALPFLPLLSVRKFMVQLATQILNEPSVPGSEAAHTTAYAAGLLAWMSPWQVRGRAGAVHANLQQRALLPAHACIVKPESRRALGVAHCLLVKPFCHPPRLTCCWRRRTSCLPRRTRCWQAPLPLQLRPPCHRRLPRRMGPAACRQAQALARGTACWWTCRCLSSSCLLFCPPVRRRQAAAVATAAAIATGCDRPRGCRSRPTASAAAVAPACY